MIVCICNALGEDLCREAACSEECRTAGCVYRLLGVNVQCGRCLQTMDEIVLEEQDRRAAERRAREAERVDPVA